MAVGKVKTLNRIKKGVTILSQIFMLCQIIFVIIVLLCSLYLFLGLLKSHAFDFLTPFIAFAKSFIHTVFGSAIKSTQPEIDGEIVLYVFINIFLVFVFAQMKLACKRYVETVDKQIVQERLKEEEAFNRELESELQRDLLAQKNFILLVRLKARPIVRDTVKSSMVPKEEIEKANNDIISKFFEEIKALPGLSFSKDGDILLISSSKFELFENTVTKVFELIDTLKSDYRAKKILLRSRMAADVYKSNVSVKDAYKNIRPLIDLNANNEILCFGNFNNRYKLIKNPKFRIYIKGQYDINSQNETVWALVKNN